ncbi:MAG TPA: hypothetical protein VM890_01920 [Longimicrobium sp.]|jgi:hypothetical protein|nr:hypothetical protein [Longimicrobium sp.]
MDTPQTQRDREALRALLLLVSAALATEAALSVTTGWGNWFNAFGSLLLVSAATLVLGGLFGFLFGIPRALQRDVSTASTPSPATYSPNTNLEQISDWLTKILVGVGLTQLGKIPHAIQDLSVYVADVIPAPRAAPVAGAILIFYTTAGFLIAYLWTRLYLARELKRADSLEIEIQIGNVLNRDADAYNQVNAQLYPDPEAPAPTQQRLTEVVAGASPAMKAQIFHLARVMRRDNWRESKEKMERVIPVLRALAAADTAGRFHRTHGQLGYAVKDSREPKWEEAIRELSEAISIRDRLKQQGYRLYEANRAWCRIALEATHRGDKPSPPEVRQLILADLQAARESDVGKKISSEEPVQTWLKLNGFAPDLTPLL